MNKNRNKEQSYLDSLRREADHLLIKISWVLGAISAVIAWHDAAWTPFLAIAVPALVATSLQVYFNDGTRASRMTMASGFMVFAALIIHQMHGMIEMHFFVFVLLAMLLYYRDWLPIVTAAAVIAVHHLGFYALTLKGVPVYIFADNASLLVVLVHAAFVVAESFVLIVMSVSLRREVQQVGFDPQKLAALSAAMARGEAVAADAEQSVPAGSVAAAMFRMSRVVGDMFGEIQTVVGAQAHGDFSQRLSLKDCEGKLGELATAINSACEQTAKAMHEVVAVLDGVAHGDLSKRIESDLDGSFRMLKAQTNGTVEFLDRFRSNQQALIADAREGLLERRLDLEGAEGYQLELAAGLNQLLDTFEGTVSSVSQMLSALAEGRLDGALQIDCSNGRFGELARDSEESMQSLRSLLGSIGSVVEQVSVSTREIAQGNRDLSSRTESQSIGLQRTATSATQLAVTVRQNAEHARDADRLAQVASEVARSGAVAVETVVQTMGQINESSTRIGDIISVIDGIAFQTNILALNAAVEAARAGEQGRGFAVVASEVRSLAQRSAAAAKEIKQLVGDSVSRVGVGARNVATAGTKMNEVVTQISNLAQIIAHISAASSEQSIGVEQISNDIAGMDEIAQQNAAMVEQVSSASLLLDDSTRSLLTAVARFDLGEGYVAGADEFKAEVVPLARVA